VRTFTKRTVVLLAAGTFALASLGVLATQPTNSGQRGHDMHRSMDARYDCHDSHMSGYNWFGRWRDRGSDHCMMDRADMMDDDCRHDMNWHNNRGHNKTLPPVGQNLQDGKGSF